MIIMYESNPSLNVKVEKTERVPDEEFTPIKRRAILFLKAKQYSADVISHFEETPSELWAQEASDGKKRYMLWWDATVAEYVEMERRLEDESYFQHIVFPAVCDALEAVRFLDVRTVVMGVKLEEEENVQVVSPKLRTSSDIVDIALRDAETLIKSSGAPSALDRAHTAFHAYLREASEDVMITVAKDADITTLFGQLRDKHPKLKILDSQADRMMVDILRGFARAINALNPVRNNKSLAHPNPLLDPPEATASCDGRRSMYRFAG
jgi:Abortive infection C-terminus